MFIVKIPSSDGYLWVTAMLLDETGEFQDVEMELHPLVVKIFRNEETFILIQKMYPQARKVHFYSQ